MSYVIRGIIYALYTILFLLPAMVPLVPYFSGNWYSFFHEYSVGMWLGILSYACFLNTLILSARIRILDRMFGHDRVMVFHGYMAILGLTFAFLHKINKEKFFSDEGLQVSLGQGALAVFIFVIFFSLLLMVQGRIHRIPFLYKVKRFTEKTKLGDYSKLKLIHNTVSAAAILMAVHVFMATSTQASKTRIWIMAVYAALAIGIWIYHKFIRILIMKKNSWRVQGLSHPASGITEFTLTRPKYLARHKAGQFAYVRFRDSDISFEEHPFTISSAPSEKTPRFTVKALGDYTSNFSKIEPDTEVLVDGPYGKFTPEITEQPLLLIAGGIGITPFISILSEWKDKHFKGQVTMIWSCRTSEELIHRDLFESLVSAHEQFTFIPVLTREGDKKRITKEFLEKTLKDKPEKVYFCGPEPLRKACTGYLKQMGIKSNHIHFEKFS